MFLRLDLDCRRKKTAGKTCWPLARISGHRREILAAGETCGRWREMLPRGKRCWPLPKNEPKEPESKPKRPQSAKFHENGVQLVSVKIGKKVKLAEGLTPKSQKVKIRLRVWRQKSKSRFSAEGLTQKHKEWKFGWGLDPESQKSHNSAEGLTSKIKTSIFGWGLDPKKPQKVKIPMRTWPQKLEKSKFGWGLDPKSQKSEKSDEGLTPKAKKSEKSAEGLTPKIQKVKKSQEVSNMSNLHIVLWIFPDMLNICSQLLFVPLFSQFPSFSKFSYFPVQKNILVKFGTPKWAQQPQDPPRRPEVNPREPPKWTHGENFWPSARNFGRWRNLWPLTRNVAPWREMLAIAQKWAQGAGMYYWFQMISVQH